MKEFNKVNLKSVFSLFIIKKTDIWNLFLKFYRFHFQMYINIFALTYGKKQSKKKHFFNR